jgi:hypothetical protein
VLVEVERAKGAEQFDPDRFELLIGMLFGLANDGRVDRKGRPFPLQAAVIAKEYADVIVFTQPSPAIQRVALGILEPLGRSQTARTCDAGSRCPRCGWPFDEIKSVIAGAVKSAGHCKDSRLG